MMLGYRTNGFVRAVGIIYVLLLVNDDTFTNWVCMKQNWWWARAEQLIHWTRVLCAVKAVLVLENGSQISSTLNREPFLSDTSDLRTDELMMLRMRDSANSDCLLWLTQHVWTKLWTTDSVLMLSGARSQEFHSPKHTCCGDVTIKVIWFNALFCMNLTTTWLMGNKQHSEIFRQTFS